MKQIRRNDDAIDAICEAIGTTDIGPVARAVEGSSAITLGNHGRTITVYYHGTPLGTFVIGGRETSFYGFMLRGYRFRGDYPVGPVTVCLANGENLRTGGMFGNPIRTCQDQLRNRMQKMFPDATLVIPFDAITAAGIDVETVTPIHVTTDEWEEKTRESATAEGVPEWRRTYKYLRPDGTECAQGFGHVEGWEKRRRYSRETAPVGFHKPTGGYVTNPGTGAQEWKVTNPPDDLAPCRYANVTTPDADGIYRWQETEHHLGQSLFVASWRADGKNAEGEYSSVSGRSLFLSGFDTDTARTGRPIFGRIYFLAQLPDDSRAQTVEEAIHDLAPELVHYRRRFGFDVLRQGDMFAIETDLSTRELRDMGATFGLRHDGNGGGRIEGTGSHSAGETALLPDGRLYARGTVRHLSRSAWRPIAEHKPLYLGTVWHRILPNTVPHILGRMRAWTTAGRVD